MRLTPLYFTFSRKQDIENIIKKFFVGQEFTLDFDIEITPAKVTFLCEKYDHGPVSGLIDALKSQI